ncbi:MAG: flagellar export chaperone FliS [Syntrophales bacterium]|nr:flagellar export chaperone FliS [Syntrophales bacterium]
MIPNALNSYREVSCFTASPIKLVVMCYEQAIAHLKAAKEAYEKKDYATKGQCVTKVIDIIHELNSSLDMEKGGDISRNLRSLYLYMLKTLTEADLKRDLEKFDHIAQLLEELAGAWRIIASQSIKEENKLDAASTSYVDKQKVVEARNWHG